MTSIAARLDKLEARMPAPVSGGRMFRVIVHEGDDTGAKLSELGFDPGSSDFAIVRRIVHPKRGPHHA